MKTLKSNEENTDKLRSKLDSIYEIQSEESSPRLTKGDIEAAINKELDAQNAQNNKKQAEFTKQQDKIMKEIHPLIVRIKIKNYFLFEFFII